MGRHKALAVALLSAVAAFVAGAFFIADGARHPSSAVLRAGTDDAFAISGMEPRENLVGGGVLRWTGPRAEFRFHDLGGEAIDIALDVRDHRTEVTVTANGATIGHLAQGERQLRARLAHSPSPLTIGLSTEGFVTAGGRRLGTQFESLVVTPQPSSNSTRVPRRFALLCLASLILAAVAQALFGQPLLLAYLAPAVLLAMTSPAGLWRSPWALTCAALLVASAFLGAWVGRCAKDATWARVALQVALMTALTVHALLPPSPLIIQSDAQLHGNKLGEVARGNWFPTSFTDHKTPFEFPYGFSFYGLLSPLAATSVENVHTVRYAAAGFTALSILAFGLALARSSTSLAAVSLVLLTFGPANLRTMAYGNLNNVFAQALFVLFLSLSILLRPGIARSAVLSILVALSATAHLSAFIFLAVLFAVACLFRSGRQSPAFKPLALGTALAAAYFGTFLPLIVRQLPRLVGEHGGSAGVFDPWRLPIQVVTNGAGAGMILLVCFAAFGARTRAVWPIAMPQIAAAALLAILGLVSPIEVRYMLAVLPLLAVLGGCAFLEPRLTERGFPAQDISSIIPLRAARFMVSPRVVPVASILLLLWAVLSGIAILEGFLPLAAAGNALLH